VPSATTKWKRAAAFILTSAFTLAAARAQTFTTLANFDGTDGANPNATLAQDLDGNLYGTTEYGGLPDCQPNGTWGCGSVFKVTTTGATTLLYGFNGTDGYYPGGLTQAPSGDFYGPSLGGENSSCGDSEYGCGLLFELTPNGTLSTLYTFAPGRTVRTAGAPARA
jgi:uncharacterized repeat protein (TIGR03803 family)